MWEHLAVSSAVVHLRRARDHADRFFAEPLDVAAMARAANCSRAHFIRSFRDAYGETPMRYVTRRRIERAQDLLRTANLTVTEISIAVGFRSLGSFSTRFRELVGTSPSDYREQHGSAIHHVPGCFLFMRGLDRLTADPPSDRESSTLGEASDPEPSVPSNA